MQNKKARDKKKQERERESGKEYKKNIRSSDELTEYFIEIN